MSSLPFFFCLFAVPLSLDDKLEEFCVIRRLLAVAHRVPSGVIIFRGQLVW